MIFGIKSRTDQRVVDTPGYGDDDRGYMRNGYRATDGTHYFPSWTNINGIFYATVASERGIREFTVSENTAYSAQQNAQKIATIMSGRDSVFIPQARAILEDGAYRFEYGHE